MLGAVLAASLCAANADWSDRRDDRHGDRDRGHDRDASRRHYEGGYRDSGYRDSGYRSPRYYAPSIVVVPSYVHRDYCAPVVSVEAQAQLRLRHLGYYYGPIDGSFGYGSQRALIRFQQDHYLPASGYLDWRTRRALGV